GSDSNSGITSSPWKTFSFALSKLKPGDTLVLKDGTYTAANSGFPNIVGNVNVSNGTASQPITVRTENERRAFLQSDHSQAAWELRDLAYWTSEVLRIRGADNPTGDFDPIQVCDSNNLVFRRLLVTHNNRYKNTELMLLYNTSSTLVEESEFYYCHRNCVSSK